MRGVAHAARRVAQALAVGGGRPLCTTGAARAAAPPSQAARSRYSDDGHIYDAIVVGGGVVGLSVARALAVKGASVAVLEREDAVLAAASTTPTHLRTRTHTHAPTPTTSTQPNECKWLPPSHARHTNPRMPQCMVLHAGQRTVVCSPHPPFVPHGKRPSCDRPLWAR